MAGAAVILRAVRQSQERQGALRSDLSADRLRGPEEIDYSWNKLTADGGEEGPCGWLEDKFGLSWQIVPAAVTRMLSDPDPARRNRVMDAMLKMKKPVVAEFERAFAG